MGRVNLGQWVALMPKKVSVYCLFFFFLSVVGGGGGGGGVAVSVVDNAVAPKDHHEN